MAELPLETGMVLQSIRADEYRGKRIRLTGYMRSDGVAGGAGLFARVDGNWAEVHGDYLDHIEPKGREGLVFATLCDGSECPHATPAEQAAINRLVWTRV